MTYEEYINDEYNRALVRYRAMKTLKDNQTDTPVPDPELTPAPASEPPPAAAAEHKPTIDLSVNIRVVR